MFFSIIGIGVFIYGIIYTIATCFVDCDLELAFYEKFGKSIGRLKGKVVFITGASSGIGEHIAVALAKHGVKLVLAARRVDELERVKRTCISVSNGMLSENDVLVIPMDILHLDSHKAYFDQAVRHFGSVDILLNNAGRSQRAAWEDIDLDVDREMFELNVFCVVNLTRVAVNYFKSRGLGHVAVTSSLAGIIGVPFSGSYDGSKHAIHGYFNGLRTEKTGKNISVTLLCPGPIFTNFLSESFTGKPGEKYGISVQATDKRMTGERCGQLCAVALANKTRESWMALFPLIPFSYTAVYFPQTFNFFLKVLGPERLYRLRDGDKKPSFTEGKTS